jgi:beta-N-acetylhexosaminidase
VLDLPPPPAHVAQARALTPAQLAGQRVVFAFSGTTPPTALAARIRRGEAAGVLLFGPNVRSIAQVRRLTRALQAIPRPPGLRAPLVVMVDQEGGTVKRLPGAPTRSAPQMAAAGTATARAEGAATARLLRRAGVNVDLAPVADVARPGSQMEREGRAFGATASAAGTFAGAFTRGLVGGGVVATAKHFPGFGAAAANTDSARVRIGASAAELTGVDEPPFRAVTEAGARLAMLSSAVYPALDERPALLSGAVVRRLRTFFDGVTVTDSLDAAALAPYRDVPVRAARAGADLLLFSSYGSAARAVEALRRARQAGRLPAGPMRAAAARVLRLRAGLSR